MRPTAASTIDGKAAQALQIALGAEHAAIWCYALAVAFLAGPQVDQARRDADAHRTLRARVEQTLTQIGQRPASAQPAYAVPQPVTDARSAAGLAVVAETDGLTAWRAVLEQTTDDELRRAGLSALVDGTQRCARWRTAVGTAPAILVFPGRP